MNTAAASAPPGADAARALTALFVQAVSGRPLLAG